MQCPCFDLCCEQATENLVDGRLTGRSSRLRHNLPQLLCRVLVDCHPWQSAWSAPRWTTRTAEQA